MKIAWHGSASITIKFDGIEILTDPHFSKKTEYGGWYVENPNAPQIEEYLDNFNPDLVFITHGHFDHFDLHTVDKINKAKAPAFVGSYEAVWALKYYFDIPDNRLLPLKGGEERAFRGLSLKAYEGVHWITGEEGSLASEKLRKRPDRYGVMPCGGPNLGLIIEGKEGRAYISGDTLLEGIPREKVDYAVIFTGGKGLHPVTKEPTKAITDPDDVALAVRDYLQPRVVIPVHYDLPVMEPINADEMAKNINKSLPGTKTVIPPYHTWVEV